MSSNNYQGRRFKLEIFDSVSNTFKLIGGVKTRQFTRDNPVEDATNASSEGNESESQYTGYSSVTVNGSGLLDSRYNDRIAAYKYLEKIAHSSDPTVIIKLSNPQSSFQGPFTIVNFSIDGDEKTLIKFSFSLQSAGTIEYV